MVTWTGVLPNLPDLPPDVILSVSVEFTAKQLKTYTFQWYISEVNSFNDIYLKFGSFEGMNPIFSSFKNFTF